MFKTCIRLYHILFFLHTMGDGPGSSIRCTSTWYTDLRGRSAGPAKHSFMQIGHEIIFYNHSLPTADSSWAVASYWRKDCTKYSRPTSFGQKYGVFSFFCNQVDIFQQKVYFLILERLSQHQHFWLNKKFVHVTYSAHGQF